VEESKERELLNECGCCGGFEEECTRMEGLGMCGKEEQRYGGAKGSGLGNRVCLLMANWSWICVEAPTPCVNDSTRLLWRRDGKTQSVNKDNRRAAEEAIG